jgi:hypothetical protein
MEIAINPTDIFRIVIWKKYGFLVRFVKKIKGTKKKIITLKNLITRFLETEVKSMFRFFPDFLP